MNYDALFKPIKINGMTLKNRLIMSPVTTRLADADLAVSERMVDYWAERARGGAAMICTEAFYLKKEYCSGGNNVILDTDLCIPGIANLADAIHMNGSKLCVQLGAGPGRNSIFCLREGRLPMSASAVPSVADPNIVCRAMEIDEIEGIIQLYHDAAERVKMAGADAICIHAHNGYLIDQFMSPEWNLRTDEYGGSFEGRMKFPVEIIKAVRSAVGAAFPIIFRITLDHMTPTGRKVKDGIEILKYLEDKGVDAFDIDAGSYEALDYIFTPFYNGTACELFVADGVKASGIKLPLINAGAHTPESALKAVEDGLIDIAMIGRGFVADPEFANKLKNGQREDIRPCLRCNEECSQRIISRRVPISCAVNCQVGQERRFAITKAAKPVKLAVIGAGPAGLEAARVAALEGHEVELFDRDSGLGGQMQYISTPDFKSQMKALVRWYTRQMKELGIKVTLGREITPGDAALADADVIFFAGGSRQIRLPLLGIDRENVMNVLEAHKRAAEIKDNTVVIAGGGLSGCDLALELSMAGNRVTVVEMTEKMAGDVFAINKIALMRMLKENNVTLLPGHKAVGITESSLEAEVVKTGERRELAADLIIYSFGSKPDEALISEYKKVYGDRLAVIGDSSAPGKICNAIHSGYSAAFNIR